MNLYVLIMGAGTLGIIGFAILTAKDLIKHLVRKARDKKKNGGGANTGEAGQPTFPKILLRNLILLPIACAVIAVLVLLMPVLFPVR